MAGREHGRGLVSARLLVAIGTIAYVACWFLPAWTPAVSTAETREREFLPGWMAFRFAWEFMVFDDATLHWSVRLVYATCLTNALMPIALAMSFVRRARLGFGIGLLVCAGVNSVWLRLALDTPSPLGLGYYTWLASFVLVGLGMTRHPGIA